MALADTAHLVVQLRLDDKLSRPLGNNIRQMNTLSGTMTNVAKRSVFLGSALSTAFGIGLERAVVSGIGFLSRSVHEGIASAQELENQQAQTEAAIKSTGGAAGVTAQQIRDMSEAFENQNALIDDKVIQSGANVLLTFRHIREDAFQPALAAALDLSTALGTDLQTSILQVGKALEDPVRGVTALRRAGVQLSEEQQKQIKQLVEQNDLYGAQQIILKELSTQVGGRFAAAGKTAAANTAAFKDSIEDLRIAFAQHLLPGIVKVQDRLTKLFRSKEFIRGAQQFGDEIAKFLTVENVDKAIAGIRKFGDTLSQIPWGTIADGLKITGAAAKVAIDAFLALPKEVQGILITALAANKLSGGIVGNLAGQAIGGLFGRLRGQSAAAPLFTKEVGLPGGGGPGGPLGGGGRLSSALKILAAPAIIAVGHELTQGLARLFSGKNPLGEPSRIMLPMVPKTGTAAPFALPKGVLKTVDAQLRSVQTMQTRAIRAGNDKQARILQTTLDQLHGLRGDGKTQTSRFVAGIGKVNAALSVSNRNLREGTQKQRQIARGIEQARDRIGTGFRESNDKLGVISRKQTSFTAHVTTNVNAQLSVYSALSQVTRVTTIRSGFTPTGNFDV